MRFKFVVLIYSFISSISLLGNFLSLNCLFLCTIIFLSLIQLMYAMQILMMDDHGYSDDERVVILIMKEISCLLSIHLGKIIGFILSLQNQGKIC